MKVGKLLVLSALALVFSFVMLPNTFAQSENARVRVVHASPDAPAVDVFVDGNRVLTDVPFFAASDYLELAPGEHRFQVAPAGEAAEASVIDTTATLEAGTAYTVAATGLLDNIQPTVLVDDLSAPADGQAKVRVLHFVPDAPAVDVSVQGGDTLLSGLEFPNASDYLEVPADTYDLAVTPSGDDTVVIDLTGTTLEAGMIYDVAATGTLDTITPEVLTPPVGAAAPAQQEEPTEEPEAPEVPEATEEPEAMAATEVPAAATATPVPAAGAPSTLPTTAEGTTTPLTLLVLGALVLVGLGAFLLHRRMLG